MKWSDTGAKSSNIPTASSNNTQRSAQRSHIRTDIAQSIQKKLRKIIKSLQLAARGSIAGAPCRIGLRISIASKSGNAQV